MKKPKIILEGDKKPGVSYVIAANGLELPVVDITHPAFHVEPDEARFKVLEKAFLDDQAQFEKLPALLRHLVFSFFMNRSLLGRGLLAARGTFLSGMSTYIMKLGPENLGKGYATAMDRRLAGSLAGLAMRVRLQDIAGFIAGALAPQLAKAPSAQLHFVNIAGGPSMDTMNTLILLNKREPALLRNREIKIHILDRDTDGPAFALNALKALQASGAPLEGVAATAAVTPFDWSDSNALMAFIRSNVPKNAVTAVSSEGGIFDYCDDTILCADMKAIHAATPENTVLAGTLTRPDDIGRKFNATSRATTIPRGLEEFAVLAAKTGWKVDKSVLRPVSTIMLLAKRTITN